MKLVYSDSGKEVKIGDRATGFLGDTHIVEATHEPKHPGSNGHVTTSRGYYYAKVINAEWIDRTDQVVCSNCDQWVDSSSGDCFNECKKRGFTKEEANMDVKTPYFEEEFKDSPRDYALELVEAEVTNADHLLLCALKFMSHDEVRDMLDCNELSPRFFEEHKKELDRTQGCACDVCQAARVAEEIANVVYGED